MSFAHFARVASLLGFDDDAAKYQGLAEQTAQQFNENFFSGRDHVYRPVNDTCGRGEMCTGGPRAFGCPPCNTTRCPCYPASTQCGQALPLYLGIARAPALVLRQLQQNVERNGNAMLVGMQCVEPFFMALSEGGLVDVAFESVMRRGFPGYGWMLANNATTLWEDMRLDDEGHSHNHAGAWARTNRGGLRFFLCERHIRVLKHTYYHVEAYAS